MLTQVLRLTGALALSVVGILAANPSKNDQPIVPLATSPPTHGELLKSAYMLANKLNVTPQMSEKAADLDKEFKKDIEDLKAKKDGPELDKEFMDEQIDLYQEAIGALKDLDEKTKDATLKGAISAAPPKMEAHLDRAKLVRHKFG